MGPNCLFETFERPSPMKPFLIACLAFAAGGCVADPPRSDFGISVSSSSLLPPRANTAPRGTREFCRIYGQQTADNRYRSSSGVNGREPSGVDIPRAEREGERAAARCMTGRLN